MHVSTPVSQFFLLINGKEGSLQGLHDTACTDCVIVFAYGKPKGVLKYEISNE